MNRHDVEGLIQAAGSGSRLGLGPKAFVTLIEDAQIDGAALKDWLNPQLGKHERVCEVEVRLNLPRTLVGKLSRKELVAEERAKAAAMTAEAGTAA